MMVIDAGEVMLRPYLDRDRSTMVSMLTSADLMQRAMEDRVFSRTEAERYIDNHFGYRGRIGYGTVWLKSTKQSIGFSGFRTCTYLGGDDLEFGCVLASEYHGRGYVSALAEQLIIHALETWELPRVLGASNPLNRGSEHILRDKLHMQFEREVEVRKGYRRRVYSAARGWRL